MKGDQVGRMARCAHCGGLYELRHDRSIEQEALALLAADLEGVHEDTWRFFVAVWTPAPGYSTARQLSRDLAVCDSSLNSRFFREGLPTPKRYLLLAQLTRAARMLEDGSVTVVQAASALELSSASSLGRTLRHTFGLTGSEFRQMHDGASMLEHFRQQLVLPHLDRLRALSPLKDQAVLLPRRRRSAVLRRVA